MSIKNRKEFSKEVLCGAIESSTTMSGAAKMLNVDWRTFRWSAEKHNIYFPTPPQHNKKFSLKDILEGKHPQYSTAKLSKRLVDAGLKVYKCNRCGIDTWNNEKITLELDHINGDNSDHSIDNLELLCPNCHSQTPTYRNKKRRVNLSGIGLALKAM